MSILCRISHVWNRTVEGGPFSLVIRNLLKNTNQVLHGYHREEGIFEETDVEGSQFNRRGAYVELSSRKRESRFGQQHFDNSSRRNWHDEKTPRTNWLDERQDYDRLRERNMAERQDYDRFRERNMAERQDYDRFRERNMAERQPFRRSTLGERLTTPNFNSLPPIEKNFYSEHPDVENRSEEEVESYRSSMGMNISGKNILKPITQFSELCLPEGLKRTLLELGHEEPTPIQAQGWPIALSGHDMVGVSQTGSGKTLVFMLPAVVHALNNQHKAVPSYGSQQFNRRPQVLVLGPTRELVQQIEEASEPLVRGAGLFSACAYGGASKGAQLRRLSGAQVCVATPGRLIDFVSEGQVNLASVSYLVLDEADRMLDMGFEPQIRTILQQIRPDRQTLMWSATWPQDIRSLAEDFLRDYVRVTIGSEQLSANPNIKQNVYLVDEWDKKPRLISLLKEIFDKGEGKVLIFAQTKKTVDFLGYFLNDNNIPALCIHGDVSQTRRDHVLQTFRYQKQCVLVATDVAARGLDISDVQNVVNFDFPETIEDYIHRIGRTARGNRSGQAHAFFTSKSAGLARELVATLQQTGQEVDERLHTLWEEARKGSSPFQRRHFDRRQYAASKL